MDATQSINESATSTDMVTAKDPPGPATLSDYLALKDELGEAWAYFDNINPSHWEYFAPLNSSHTIFKAVYNNDDLSHIFKFNPTINDIRRECQFNLAFSGERFYIPLELIYEVTEDDTKKMALQGLQPMVGSHLALVYEWKPSDLRHVLKADKLEPFPLTLKDCLAYNILFILQRLKSGNYVHCNITPDSVVCRLNLQRFRELTPKAIKEMLPRISENPNFSLPCRSGRFFFELTNLSSACKVGESLRDATFTPEYTLPDTVSTTIVSPEMDHYAAALILHELYTGHSPIPSGLNATVANKLKKSGEWRTVISRNWDDVAIAELKTTKSLLLDGMSNGIKGSWLDEMFSDVKQRLKCANVIFKPGD
ncbi:hypothetical protein BKA69DRAFT_765158 [Paraphysoderma sedebokerense]|nr:hypothetical protein BKA69DRAFT_764582 [Paraphysoderma sedebokerense]KAI9138604.1 hypothetical protein BKA69DRAFT_765158 [Paraphysoderma sedebokerense]